MENLNTRIFTISKKKSSILLVNVVYLVVTLAFGQHFLDLLLARLDLLIVFAVHAVQSLVNHGKVAIDRRG